VVLRKQPDRVTWMQKSQLGLREASEDLELVKH